MSTAFLGSVNELIRPRAEIAGVHEQVTARMVSRAKLWHAVTALMIAGAAMFFT
jgi:hypothetical protein